MLNWIDWVIVAVVGLSSLISLKRGFFKEALSLTSWALAIFIATTFRSQMSLILQDAIVTKSLREIIAFISLFLATLLVGGLVNFLVGQLLRVTGLKTADRVIGMAFGVTRGALIVLLALMLLPSLLPVKEEAAWQKSTLIPHFALVEDWVYKVMPKFDRFQQVFGGMKTQAVSFR